MSRLGRYWLTGATVLAVVALVGLLAAWEGDLLDQFGDIANVIRARVSGLGPAASVGLLYLEESGVPLPVPGDAILVYVGRQVSWPAAWLAAWLAVMVVVLGGASNLYLVSRRFGPRLARHRLSGAFHLNPHRVEVAARWFRRWGPPALIFGRHVPGFRIPLTVTAGTLRMPYRTFVISIVISAAPWAAFWLWLGRRYGPGAETFLRQHSWIAWLGSVVIAAIVAYFLVRIVRALQQPDP